MDAAALYRLRPRRIAFWELPKLALPDRGPAAKKSNETRLGTLITRKGAAVDLFAKGRPERRFAEQALHPLDFAVTGAEFSGKPMKGFQAALDSAGALIVKVGFNGIGAGFRFRFKFFDEQLFD